MRDKKLDWLRILFASMVILSHAQLMTGGGEISELVGSITHGYMTLGGVSVYGFFLLSGFLIVKSWHKNPDPIDYIRKRVLRIVPGYLVAVTLSILVVGSLAPAAPGFFSHLGLKSLASIVLLYSPSTPPVLPGFLYPSVNGSLWTISFEFSCYIFVLLFGMLRMFRFPLIWLASTAILIALSMFHAEQSMLIRALGLFSAFFVGACFYLFPIKFRPSLAILATASLVGVALFYPSIIRGTVILVGGYLMFYFAQIPLKLPSFPDVSYGVYLYGWPVESLWIWYHHGSPWVTFLVSTPICFVLGWMSWTFVESPALEIKQSLLVTQ